MKEDCIFCLISTGRVPARVVAENERVMAFRDLNPAAPEHVLLIPREHVADSLADLEDTGIVADIVALARTVAVAPEFERGWRLVSNVGPHAGQSIYHLHFHLLSGRPMGWPPG